MSFAAQFSEFTPWPTLSILILFIVAVFVLFLARETAHQAIRTATSAIARGLRLASHSTTHLEARLATRNRDVLLAAGREAKERIIEREFERISESVRKGPVQLSHAASCAERVDPAHRGRSPGPPSMCHRKRRAGYALVDAVAKMEGKNGAAAILEDIHKSLVKAHKEAMDTYPRSQRRAATALRKMMPE